MGRAAQAAAGRCAAGSVRGGGACTRSRGGAGAWDKGSEVMTCVCDTRGAGDQRDEGRRAYVDVFRAGHMKRALLQGTLHCVMQRILRQPLRGVQQRLQRQRVAAAKDVGARQAQLAGERVGGGMGWEALGEDGRGRAREGERGARRLVLE